MALNKNHEYEDLDGVRCGIVEKNVKPERLSFFTNLLKANGYTVIAMPSPPAKAATPKPAEGEDAVEIAPAIETFTVGVTNYTFNPINAIFGRLLKTKDGEIITWAYWNQQLPVNDDTIPYFDKKETWK